MHVTESRLVFMLRLIGCENDACFLDQLESFLKQSKNNPRSLSTIGRKLLYKQVLSQPNQLYLSLEKNKKLVHLKIPFRHEFLPPFSLLYSHSKAYEDLLEPLHRTVLKPGEFTMRERHT